MKGFLKGPLGEQVKSSDIDRNSPDRFPHIHLYWIQFDHVSQPIILMSTERSFDEKNKMQNIKYMI